MIDLSNSENQIQLVENFSDLLSTPFEGKTNAICWERKLIGDFSEIVRKLELTGNIAELDQETLRALQLSQQGQLAREILINDLNVLQENGASPVLNLIRYYEKDDSFFPTDVYSYHVDRSPIPTNTFLCTYHGEPSEIISNFMVEQKILIPEIRAQLKELYDGQESGFESFLSEYFFDLHYQAKPSAQPTNLRTGNIWRIAVDHPGSTVLPCVHRAPIEKEGEVRLLLIC